METLTIAERYQPPALPQVDTKQPLILSVDDDRMLRLLIARILGKNNYKVITAESGQEALEILETQIPDLILLDATMPGMSGYELCTKLQENEQTAYIPVIFVTANVQEQDKAKAFAVGAVDYLPKPIDNQVLFEKIEQHLKTKARWQEIHKAQHTPTIEKDERPSRAIRISGYGQFQKYLLARLALTPDKWDKLLRSRPSEPYALSTDFGITNQEMAQHIATFTKWPYIPKIDPDKLLLGVIPIPFCRSNQVLAISNDKGNLTFVLSNAFDLELLDILPRFAGQNQSPEFMITEPENIAAMLAGRKSAAKDEVTIADIEKQLQNRYDEKEETIDLSEQTDGQAEPIILLVNKLIETAYRMGASDIHIEPGEGEVVVRYRIDGDLHIVNHLRPSRLINPIVARIKVMSQLDIAERRLPQDGRIIFKRFNRKNIDVDLRVSTAPMNFGEKVVMRLLDKQGSVMPLYKLGFSERNLKLYTEKIAIPYGMILHVGPTGAGKSMTLYAAINSLQRPELNVQTIENPIEYTLPGINQLQVNPEIGLTFQRALRAYLRQDPDVILVGEIRDHETASIAFEAALTGHLLLSTLHTNDATSTVIRLIDMGIDPYLVSSSTVLICAQRLLRRLCSDCKQPYQPNEEECRYIGVAANTNITLYRSHGCSTCNNIGYKGRVGIHEVLAVNDTLRAAINRKGITAEVLKRLAVEECGLTTLYWDTMEKVRDGITSLEEAFAKIRKDEFDSRPEWMFEELGLKRPDSREKPLF
ncbi:MAG: ATPase, T2SS/T4P/T4SS family [Acidobacteriota bacterium]